MKSGTAIERHWRSSSAEGTTGGEHERAPPLVRGYGRSPEKIFRFKKSVEAILMRFEAIFACETRLIVQKLYEVFKLVSNPPPKYEQLFRSFDRSHQAVASKFTVTKSNDSYLQHVL